MGEENLSEIFNKLYMRREEFRRNVDRLRLMLLDPDTLFDGDEALTLFNKVLREMGFSETDKSFLKPRKSVLVKAAEVPEPPACREERLGIDLVFMQPRIDVEKGNGLRRVYFCKYMRGDKEVLEVTLVFGDEDRLPSGSKLDLWYDVWRLIAWGRLQDIETFYIVRKESTYEIDLTGLQLILRENLGVRKIPPIGSGGKGYFEAGHEYEVEVVRGDKIVVYVNTWNHALSTIDTNPRLVKEVFTLDNVEVKIGSRMDVENELSAIKYISEIPGI